MTRLRPILIVLAGLNLLIVLELAVLLWTGPLGETIAGRAGRSLAPVLQKVIPAVVTLRVSGYRKTPVELGTGGTAGSGTIREPKLESFKTGGSGVIVDPDHGYVITNNHVIEGATTIDVGLADGRHRTATLIGRDVGTDLAVLRIDAKDIPSLKLGNSDVVRVGDMVVAVGNPFGLEGTATSGIVSALMRTEIGHEAFEDYFQIDAQTNPGNSGGALVNVRGELIGINTVVAGGRSAAFTIGFAIPINMARAVMDELVVHGRMRRGSPGLVVEDLLHMAESGIVGVTQGAVVSKVIADTPAAAQGIKRGDVIAQVAGKPVRSAAEYMMRVSTVPLGGKLPVVVHSEGRKRNVTLTIASVPLEPMRKLIPATAGDLGGVAVGDILPGNPVYGELRGAQVLEAQPSSNAGKSGLIPGDVIVRIDGNRVVSPEDLIRRVEQAGLQFRLDIVRDGTPAWLRISR
ncbi:MAG TPA: trypsin-like peptidase domain-containing protein [Hyphomicrobiaceae bacterium]|nr:trypsin-like peptidase domain-containing protein [Hyphomicrobiaceae bacterium]